MFTSTHIWKDVKRSKHMNAPSVSALQPPADFSCCILEQTPLYLSELKHTHTKKEALSNFTLSLYHFKGCAQLCFRLNKTKLYFFFCLILQPLHLPWQITDSTRVALMSESLEMFSLCHIALVDLGQRFLCNLAVITKEGCTGKTEWFQQVFCLQIQSGNPLALEKSPSWSSPLPRKQCCRVFIQCSDACDSDWKSPLFLSEMV